MYCSKVLVKSGVVGNMERDGNREIWIRLSPITDFFFFFFGTYPTNPTYPLTSKGRKEGEVLSSSLASCLLARACPFLLFWRVNFFFFFLTFCSLFLLPALDRKRRKGKNFQIWVNVNEWALGGKDFTA